MMFNVSHIEKLPPVTGKLRVKQKFILEKQHGKSMQHMETS